MIKLTEKLRIISFGIGRTNSHAPAAVAGPRIISFLKQWFTEKNKTGCRYITVDALAEKVGFYEKYGFKTLVTPQEGDETVLMYYDLKKFVVSNG